MHFTDIRKLRSIYGRVARALEQTLPCTGTVHPRPRERDYERDYAQPLLRGVSAAAAVRTLVSVVMVCRNLQMRATRVSLHFCLYLFCYTLPVLFISRNTVLSELVQFLTWIRIYWVKIYQSNNTEHKFGGLEALE